MLRTHNAFDIRHSKLNSANWFSRSRIFNLLNLDNARSTWLVSFAVLGSSRYLCYSFSRSWSSSRSSVFFIVCGDLGPRLCLLYHFIHFFLPLLLLHTIPYHFDLVWIRCVCVWFENIYSYSNWSPPGNGVSYSSVGSIACANMIKWSKKKNYAETKLCICASIGGDDAGAAECVFVN